MLGRGRSRRTTNRTELGPQTADKALHRQNIARHRKRRRVGPQTPDKALHRQNTARHTRRRRERTTQKTAKRVCRCPNHNKSIQLGDSQKNGPRLLSNRRTVEPSNRQTVKPSNRRTVKPSNRQTVKLSNRRTVKKTIVVSDLKDLLEHCRSFNFKRRKLGLLSSYKPRKIVVSIVPSIG